MLPFAIIIFILFFVTAWKRPILSLAALAALLPAYNLRFEISLPFIDLAKNGGLPSTILEFAIWGAFLGWLVSVIPAPSSVIPAPSSVIPAKAGIQFLLIPRLQKIKYPLALFFLASIISVFTAPNLYKAFGLWRAFFLEPALILIMILASIKDRRDFEKIIFGLSLSALLVSSVAIGQRFFGLPILPPWDKELRVTSIFIQPNMVGLYLGPIIILAMGQIFNFQFSVKKWTVIGYWAIVVAVSFIAIIFAKSDGAIMGALTGLVIFFVLFLLMQNVARSRHILHGIKVLFILLIPFFLFFIFYFLLPNNNLFLTVKNKLLLRDWSGFVRLNIWRETWAMLKDNWLFGAGVGGYPMKILPYHISAGWMEVYPMPHNIIFNFWSELGIFGLAAFLWLLEKFFKMCYKLLRPPLSSSLNGAISLSSPSEVRNRTESRGYIIAAIAAMSALLVHGLVDVPILKNDLSILFWIIYSIPLLNLKS